jgi:hypothetical protein
MRSSVAAMRSRSAGVELREKRAPHALVGLHRELQVLEGAVVLEDRRFWNLRPIRRGRSRLGEAREVDGLAEEARPASGRVLPVITSIIVVLPAPLGPMMQRSSPASMASERGCQRLEAVEAHRHVVEIEDDAVERSRVPNSSGWPTIADCCLRRGFLRLRGAPLVQRRRPPRPRA